MNKFSDFLTGNTNTHINHLEDLMITRGSSGFSFIVQTLNEILVSFKGNSLSSLNVSVKWDGSPAIICGTDPKSKRFFVATKALFNKKPKVNFTVEDIKKNHEGALVDILTTCLQYLPEVNIKGILQGDLLFLTKDLRKMEINGEKVLGFQPNTILYTVPEGSNLAKDMLNHKLGIAFHTEYFGEDLQHLTASYTPKMRKVHSTENVWVTKTRLDDVSGSITFTSAETQMVADRIKHIKDEGKKLASFFDSVAQSKLAPILTQYINSEIRNSNLSLSSSGFISFLTSKNLTGTINSANLDRLFALRSEIIKIKLLVIAKLEKLNELKVFIPNGDEFVATSPEGFVIADRSGNNVVKLVDRLVFSKANFFKNQKLKEERGIVVSFGRMNPPTKGHEILVEKVIAESKRLGFEHTIYLSHSAGNSKNPLYPKEKLRYVKKSFPEANIIMDESVTDPFKMLEMLSDKGYKKVVFVVGEDRILEFQDKISKQNYGFTVEMLSSGRRDSKSRGKAGISSSKARSLVEKGNFSAFQQVIPSTLSSVDKQKLFESLSRVLVKTTI